MKPFKYLSKLGDYEVEMKGVKVKVSVIDNIDVLDAKLSEFKSSIQSQPSPVVGVDVKVNAYKIEELLILCCMNSCLMIQLAKLISFPDNLIKFFDDKSICFVGIGLRDKVRNLTLKKVCVNYAYGQSISLVDIVTVGELAARVLRKPNLCKCGLTELEKEVRNISTVACTDSPSSNPPPDLKVKVEEDNLPEITCPDWKAVAFTNEEIKYAIHEVYCYCFIGDKLFGMIDTTK